MLATPKFDGLVEFAPGFQPRGGLSQVLFDFDGTLSLVREGWMEVMVSMFCEMLPAAADDTEDSRRALMLGDITRLTGKQTVYQMIQFAERVRERGGLPREPLWYKHEYLARLERRIHSRIDDLESGRVPPENYLVHGSRTLLEALAGRGLKLYLASGTDEPFVKREAALLDVAKYFGGHIYGAQDDVKAFSKKMVIERILRENGITGGSLLSFGDGYVEIENTKSVGGVAVAVASDEARNGSGRMDAWKRDRLMGVGADVCVPDYRDTGPLLELLFPA